MSRWWKKWGRVFAIAAGIAPELEPQLRQKVRIRKKYLYLKFRVQLGPWVQLRMQIRKQEMASKKISYFQKLAALLEDWRILLKPVKFTYLLTCLLEV